MVIDSQPGPSSPDGDDALVLRAPTLAALRVHCRDCDMLAAPSMSASMFAASLPDTISSASSSWRVVYGWPGFNPTQEALDLGVGLIGAGEVVGPQVVEHHHRQQRLDRGWRARAARTDHANARMRPESRSASSQAWAGPSGQRYRPGRLDVRLCGRGR